MVPEEVEPGSRIGCLTANGSVVVALGTIPLDEVNDHAREQVNGLTVLRGRDLDDLGARSAPTGAPAEAHSSFVADCPCPYNIRAGAQDTPARRPSRQSTCMAPTEFATDRQ
jgi:hypothetical protein